MSNEDKKVSNLPKWLPDIDCQHLLSVARSFQLREGSIKGNYAFLSMSLQRFGGLRISEVVRVKPRDINYSQGLEEITVVSSKSYLERVIPINDTPLVDVFKFLQAENPDPDTPYINRHPKTLWALYQKIYQASKIKYYGTHQLRHTYARDMLANGVSINLLSVLLGHKDLRSTLIYARLLPEREVISNALRKMKEARDSR